MDPSSEPPGPLPIKRLDTTVINRIAAGEIIHRPASALKELIENCLDAGATSIKITVKDGGFKLLQIQDNGSGIRKSDLPILAERHTTSKLSTFADLQQIQTYGFRGEALASISHVSHLSVITKTKADSCAWKAHYSDGKLTSPKDGTSADPRPSAGNDGTMISIEDLFYNTPTRSSSLRSHPEEYGRILEVVTKYAIHNPSVAFLCKKSGSSSPDVSTTSGSDRLQTIRQLYGTHVAKELLSAQTKSVFKPKRKRDIDLVDDSGAWEADILFSGANYQGKKMGFLLFINHRLVESPRIKKSLEAVYTAILPKGASPWVYLSLEIDPRAVDVNVHPTKKEVHFLNEEEITDQVASAMHTTLIDRNESRTFQYQTLLTNQKGSNASSKGKQRADDVDEDEEEPRTQATASTSKIRPVYSQHKVRTNTQDRTLDSMFPVDKSFKQGQTSVIDVDAEDTPENSHDGKEIKESQCFLGSILELRANIPESKHRALSEIINKHVFVGIVDMRKGLSLLQHAQKLFLVNHVSLSEEFFYQIGLRQFGNFGRIKLEPPPNLRTILSIAINAEESVKESSKSPAELVEYIAQLLISRRDMLDEYFSLSITEDGTLRNIPLLLRHYMPNLEKIPELVMRLGPQVDWSQEMECFRDVLREIAYFYAPSPSFVDQSDKAQEAQKWQIEHILFPNMRRYFIAPKSLVDSDVVQVANLPDLYKVFERC